MNTPTRNDQAIQTTSLSITGIFILAALLFERIRSQVTRGSRKNESAEEVVYFVRTYVKYA